jgi:hypothetical protein
MDRLPRASALSAIVLLALLLWVLSLLCLLSSSLPTRGMHISYYGYNHYYARYQAALSLTGAFCSRMGALLLFLSLSPHPHPLLARSPLSHVLSRPICRTSFSVVGAQHVQELARLEPPRQLWLVALVGVRGGRCRG